MSRVPIWGFAIGLAMLAAPLLAGAVGPRATGGHSHLGKGVGAQRLNGGGGWDRTGLGSPPWPQGVARWAECTH